MPSEDAATLSAPPDTAAPDAGGARPPAGDYARIEHVAQRTGLTKRTLRYYEEIGLLAPPTRTEGGYRLYSEADVQRLMRIKRLKDLLGFSLAEIREMANIEERREQVRAAWHRETDPHARLTWLDHSEELMRGQLRLVEEKLAGLEEMRMGLRERLATLARLREELHAALAEAEG
ncbi:MAG: MerR family transcriptional regulator [Ktedonobacterales bacterium]|nr:MerR family transcriptional regulator [Ktedonobacterales bacterium]